RFSRDWSSDVCSSDLQSSYSVRFDWGERGLEALGPLSDTIVIVDVLSFSTSVDIAVSRGARVLPYRLRDDSAAEYAVSKQALLEIGRASCRESVEVGE